MQKIVCGFLLLLCTSCMVQNMQYVEILGPSPSAYFGHQVLMRDTNGVQVDTSFYRDMKLQPFVESGHFTRNTKISADLVLDTARNEAVKWFSELTYSSLKRLSKESHKHKGTCIPYEFLIRMNGEGSALTVYVPEDSTRYNPDWEEELFYTSKLFKPKHNKESHLRYYHP